MVDCANAVVADHYNVPAIFSFDKFYRRLEVKTSRTLIEWHLLPVIRRIKILDAEDLQSMIE